MKKQLDIIKGVHPGVILERELKLRKLAKSRFAISVNEYPQTMVSITKGKRSMNTPLALKIEHALGLEEGYFMILQIYYDIEQEKRKLHTKKPNFSKLRRVLFWDTDMDKIDWEKYKSAAINRVFERGNAEEKKEITRFYGEETVAALLKPKKHAKKTIL